MISVEPSLIISYLREHPRLARRKTGTGTDSDRMRTEMIESLNAEGEPNDPTMEESLNELAPDEIQEILEIIGRKGERVIIKKNKI